MTSTPFSDHLSAAQGVEPDGDTIEALRTAVHTDFPQTVEQLIELAKIPGIAWAAFDPQQLDRSAEAVAELINQLGLDDIQILRLNKSDGTPGGPAVVARKIAAPGNPTILLYAHHDVQPPGRKPYGIPPRLSR